ncbi:regulatory protein RecX [Microcella sp.]|uniref:regulatory protein RecX n=1 Tax=Microcella sp. TaxID=1913979 RepID=UPI00299F7FC0|nr:regulatory protein RecX [Microcella sp.]MDX2025931.1 regulatory protein RecX [Microcella sp.]
MTSSSTTGQGPHGEAPAEGAPVARRHRADDIAGLAPVTYLPGVLEAAARAAAAEEEAAAAAKEEAAAAAKEAAEAAVNAAPQSARDAAQHALVEAEAAARARTHDSASAAQTREVRRAENVTLHAITRRGQSRAEVADLLRRREIDPVVAEAELDRLESVGLIDDRALAADLADRLRTRKKLGPSALRSELMRRKLDRAAIDEALAGTDDDGADDELVVELARDRARRLGGLDRTTAERRLVDYLARKGHSGSSAREAARQALDARGDELSGSAQRVEFR